MSITRADVADLREGDVVEVVGPRGMSVRGPLTSHGANSLVIGPVVNSGSWTVRTSAGDSGGLFADWILTVITRAPRPLYVNSDKTELDPGDVVRDADSDDNRTWQQDGYGQRDDSYHRDTWWSPSERERHKRRDLPARLRLLVDGRTGQPVPTVMERG